MVQQLALRRRVASLARQSSSGAPGGVPLTPLPPTGGLLNNGSSSSGQTPTLLPVTPKPSSSPPASFGSVPPILEPLLQGDAVFRAAANDVTGGLADNFSAGANAALGAAGSALGFGEPMDFGQRYQSNLQQEVQRDKYDSQYRPIAHTVGRALGTGLNALGMMEDGIGISDALSPIAKGRLGEILSAAKTVLKGDFPAQFQVRRPLSKSYTVLDHLTAKGIPVEAKFGYKIGPLKGAQRRASMEIPTYRVDRWTPNHIGYGAGALGGLWGLLSPDPADRSL